jgi:DNA-binding beta-propeller fold protein YncE
VHRTVREPLKADEWWSLLKLAQYLCESARNPVLGRFELKRLMLKQAAAFASFGLVGSGLLPSLARAATAAGTSSAAATLDTVMGSAIILNSRDASLSLVDRRTYKEIGRVDVGKEPHHLYPTPDGKSLIVANAVSNDLHFVDPLDGQVLQRVRGIDDPYQIAFSPDAKWFVSAALRLNRVDIYSLRPPGLARGVAPEFTLVKKLGLAKAPSHVWFSADSRWCFATLQESEEIAAIDMHSQSLAWRLQVGKLPAGIMMTADDKYLLVGVMGEDFVNVVDWRAQKSVAKIKTGAGAHNFRGFGDQRHVYVSNRVAGTVSRIDLKNMAVVDQMSVPGGPDCMELSADKRELWVTSRWAKQVSVMSTETRKLVIAIPVGRSPHGIFFAQRAPLV